jgi:hypothetical protein
LYLIYFPDLSELTFLLVYTPSMLQMFFCISLNTVHLTSTMLLYWKTIIFLSRSLWISSPQESYLCHLKQYQAQCVKCTISYLLTILQLWLVSVKYSCSHLLGFTCVDCIHLAELLGMAQFNWNTEWL